VSVRILIKQTDMPSCVFIKTCWSLSKAYCIPGKLCHFQSSGIFKLQKNGWHYEKTNVIFGLSAPKNIKKHQKIKIKKTRPKICCPVNWVQRLSPKIFKGWIYSRAIACCGYLKSTQNVFIYTTHIKKVIARLYFFILRRKITEKQ